MGQFLLSPGSECGLPSAELKNANGRPASANACPGGTVNRLQCDPLAGGAAVGNMLLGAVPAGFG